MLPDWLSLGGSVGQDISYNFAHDAPAAGKTDHRGLSGLRSRIDLEAALQLAPDWRARIEGYAFHDWAYRVQGRDGYTDAFLDAYETDADVGEAFIQGKLSTDLDVRAGRQIVVWGKSDNIRITDVLNPLDLRLPGRTDIEDLRLPVTMTKLDYFVGDWNLGAIVVHEIRFPRLSVFGSDFFTSSAPLPADDEPGEGFRDQEFAVAANGIFSGWDLSIYGARVFDDQAHAEDTAQGRRRRHARLWMGGLAANVAAGNWLIKGEAAWFDGIEFRATPDRDFARLDAMAGVEYSGFTDTTVSFEVANRHLFDFDVAIRGAPDDGRRNDVETALRATRTFLNETLELTFVASTFGLDGANGGFQRLQVDYDWSDSVEITAGVINYVSGEKLRFRGVGDNDRAFARLRYSF
jgi:hypothetical protein